MHFQDITEATKTARRGLKRDVRALCDALGEGGLFLPLGKSMRSAPGEYVTQTPEAISLHTMAARDGNRFAPAFTRAPFLSACGKLLRWTTDGGPLQYAEMQALAALQMLGKLTQAGNIHGITINPMQPEELILQPQEAEKLARREAFPIPRYIGNLPVQKDERFLEGEPAAPPPKELTDSLNALAGTEGMAGCRLRQVFNEERDLEPHLLLRVTTPWPEQRQPELAARINEAMRGKIPPPGYIDILFESAK